MSATLRCLVYRFGLLRRLAVARLARSGIVSLSHSGRMSLTLRCLVYSFGLLRRLAVARLAR